MKFNKIQKYNKILRVTKNTIKYKIFYFLDFLRLSILSLDFRLTPLQLWTFGRVFLNSKSEDGTNDSEIGVASVEFD